jgi:dipeptidyl aminopeptidase/acylaminoacyl peptidase
MSNAPFPNAPNANDQLRTKPSNWLWMTCGGVALFCLVCCGGLFGFGYYWFNATPKVSPEARTPFPLAAAPLPDFPQRGEAAPLEGGGSFHEINLAPADDAQPAAGQHGRLWLYLPPGQHAPGSLRCVLIAPAGGDMVSGMSLGDGDKQEHLPYVQAGMAVVAYELDGGSDDPSIDSDSPTAAYESFRASHAGLLNARNALEFVLARVPEVNPKQIYAAGHSSAGALALLFATHEPRLDACVAFAPVSDLPAHFEPLGMRAMGMIYPGAADFLVRSSPNTHADRINCPVLLFHADDDETVEPAQSRDFAEQLKQAGKNVELVTVESGDHYGAMIEEGIPRAIEWLQRQ